jgi:hypothetical protein
MPLTFQEKILKCFGSMGGDVDIAGASTLLGDGDNRRRVAGGLIDLAAVLSFLLRLGLMFVGDVIISQEAR